MKRKTLFLLALGSILSFANANLAFGGSMGCPAGGTLLLAAAESWFDAGVSSLAWPTGNETELVISDQGTWKSVSGLADAATYENGFLLDTADDLVFEPMEVKDVDGNDLAITATIKFTPYNYDGEELPSIPDDAKGGLLVFEENADTEPEYSFWGLAKDATSGENQWQKLSSGDIDTAAAISDGVEVSIALKLAADGSVIVNYTVDGTPLTLDEHADIPFAGDGYDNFVVSAVSLENAAKVASLAGMYDGIEFEPSVELKGEVNALAGVNFEGNTISFDVEVTTNRYLEGFGYGVVYNGKRYDAVYNDETEQWEIVIGSEDLPKGTYVSGLELYNFYEPYKSDGSVIVTNKLGDTEITICQGNPDIQPVKWIDISASTYDDATLCGGTWDITPEVEDEPPNAKLAFEDEHKFTAATPSAAGETVVSSTKIAFPLPGDISIDFNGDLDVVPHGAFTVVQTVGEDPEDDDAEFRFAFFSNGQWVTNDDVEAELNIEYTVNTKFDYANNKVYFQVSNATQSVVDEFYLSLADDQSSLAGVTFVGMGTVDSLVADTLESCANPNLVKVGGVEYADLAAAMEAGNGPYELLWDQTFDPDGERKLPIVVGDYKLVLPNGQHYESVGEYCYFSNGSDYEALIGDAWYYSLEAAFAAAKVPDVDEDPETVILQTNIVRDLVVEAGQVFVLDLNGLPIRAATEGDQAKVLTVNGGVAITNSVAGTDGEGAIVTGGIEVGTGASLQIYGGYFKQAIDGSWVASGFKTTTKTINEAVYNTVEEGEQGEPLFIIDGEKYYTAEAAEKAFDEGAGDNGITLIASLNPHENSEKWELPAGFNSDYGYIPDDTEFTISNKLDNSKWIKVSKNGDKFFAKITTKDEYAYFNINEEIEGEPSYGFVIGGVKIMHDSEGNHPFGEECVQKTAAYQGPNTTPEKVLADLLKKRNTGNGLSLFANYALGIEISSEGEDPEEDEMLRNTPLLAISNEGGVISLSGLSSVWSEYIEIDTIKEIASNCGNNGGFALKAKVFDVDAKEWVEGEAVELEEEGVEIEIPNKTGHYRVDLVFEAQVQEEE